ncbi:hypothetical protein [Kaarinaea lacus]
MLKGLDSSAIKYISALSPTAISAAGSTNAVDLSNFTFATLLVSAGSTAAATINVNVVRSATSNGTFNSFGASVSAAVLGGAHARSFVVGGSTGWHKLYYTATGAGSPVMQMFLIGQGVREVPIDQDSNTTSYSVINSA